MNENIVLPSQNKDKHNEIPNNKKHNKDLLKTIAIVFLSILVFIIPFIKIQNNINELNSKETLIKTLQDSNNQLIEQKNEAQLKNIDLKNKQLDLEQKNKDLSNQLEDLKTQKEDLEKQKEDLKKQKSELETKNKKLSDEINTLKTSKKNTTSIATPKSSSSSSSNYNTSYTVYVTNTGSKYHKSSCGYLWNSKRAINKSTAIAQGYTACSRCNP